MCKVFKEENDDVWLELRQTEPWIKIPRTIGT